MALIKNLKFFKEPDPLTNGVIFAGAYLEGKVKLCEEHIIFGRYR